MLRTSALAFCIVAFCSPALAQAETDAQFIDASFACAVFALASSEASGNQAYASALAIAALPKTKEIATATVDLFTDPATRGKGPWSNFLGSISPDFYAGMMFSRASQLASAALPQERLPNEDDAAFHLRQSVAAEIEFKNRNCALLLR